MYLDNFISRANIALAGLLTSTPLQRGRCSATRKASLPRPRFRSPRLFIYIHALKKPTWYINP